MSKRKRDDTAVEPPHLRPNGQAAKMAKTNGHAHGKEDGLVLQVVTGSYERVLHGITATIGDLASAPSVQFADTFLFNAHSSAIRCLAISPPSSPDTAESPTVLLASGGTDDRVNVYSLSASPPIESQKMPSVPTLSGNRITENPQNRELGSLLHHSSAITSLHFPTRSKLLSSSEDNTIAISRTRDLSVISTVKAPQPKAQGQPSGDTAPQGMVPAGINDFAVHPSMKLMVSVGKGERCMRLWNLVTGKKAGVLNFGKDVLQGVKEGKYSHGEGRRIEWSSTGQEFAVAFERGAVVFGEDSKPKCRILPQPLTKLHHMCYYTLPVSEGQTREVLAVSTEDGRMLFYDTAGLGHPSGGEAIPDASLTSYLGGKQAGISSRIKDFEIIPLPESNSVAIMTASSDGTIRVWHLTTNDISPVPVTPVTSDKTSPTIGTIIGTYETGSRITCLRAFLMQPSREEEEEGLSAFEGVTEGESEDVESSEGSEDE